MSSSWRTDRKNEQESVPTAGKGEKRVGGGRLCVGLHGGGESWELVTGLCEIYSNSFNDWRANSPPALSVGGQILGRAPFTSTQRERGHSVQGNKSHKQLLLWDDDFWKIQYPAVGLILGLGFRCFVIHVIKDQQLGSLCLRCLLLLCSELCCLLEHQNHIGWALYAAFPRTK